MDWQSICKCKNANGKAPLAMPIPKECKIMIVSQAPSRPASENQILADSRNRTFLQFLNVMGLRETSFRKHAYWTHYGKCYPGARRGGDQWPTVYCADKFMKWELDLCKKRGLKLVLGIAEPATKYLYKNFIEIDCAKSRLVYARLVNRIYNRGGLKWVFIKHTATTATGSRDENDLNFVKDTLRSLIHEAVVTA